MTDTGEFTDEARGKSWLRLIDQWQQQASYIACETGRTPQVVRCGRALYYHWRQDAPRNIHGYASSWSGPPRVELDQDLAPWEWIMADDPEVRIQDAGHWEWRIVATRVYKEQRGDWTEQLANLAAAYQDAARAQARRERSGVGGSDPGSGPAGAGDATADAGEG